MPDSPPPAAGAAAARGVDVGSLAEALRQGDRRALARAITLIESTRPDHRAAARALLEEILPATGGAVRLGISGVPGVGKSTFIEALGRHVIAEGHRIAVLAVDPSSARTGGSILGDKTRMEELARAPEAFIRPSPAGGTLGGVARRTREAMLACEAAGFDLVVVETVGVGQSETAVADMVDLFALLLLPGGGDELQGIKRGIVEIADLIVVNKADGAMQAAARHAAAEYRHALALLKPREAGTKVPVLQCSAVEDRGIVEVWREVLVLRDRAAAGGALDRRRADQARAWMWQEIRETLVERFRRHDGVAAALDAHERAVVEGRETPGAAAQALLAAFLGRAGDDG